ncbi:MAG TPA: TatD family hydrolase [Methylomirabilota bacterium]|jgi:TatD DNase family protein|nr:TatD family hydrolase [Methylomirabilota bacterium]
MLIDAHAHLDRYGAQIDAALAEIRRHRICTISTAMDVPSYRCTMEIGAQCALVLPTFGIHPWNALAYADRLSELTSFIEQSPLLGEIGLDFHWVKDATCFPAQLRVFEFFLAAAREQNKIVNLHTKGAEMDILRLVDRYEIKRAIIHWYSGPLDIFRELVARGYHFTVGVEVHSSAPIQTLARELPLAQLLTETDNPGGAQWLTGEPGMPKAVQQVVDAIAQLKDESPPVVANAVIRNCARLMEHDPWLAETYAKWFAAAPGDETVP